MCDVKIDVVYCKTCGYKKQFLEMVDLIKKEIPTAIVTGIQGKEGSFEIKLNNQLVYSKLQTLAFPDYEAVCETIKTTYEGERIQTITKQQPIKCIIS